jgi:hypothetical protein
MDDLTKSELNARITALEEALREAEIRATWGRLALEMIHEIRNALEALNNLTFLAWQEADNFDKARDYLQLAQEQLSTLLYTSTKTLRYSQSAFSVELSTCLASRKPQSVLIRIEFDEAKSA